MMNKKIRSFLALILAMLTLTGTLASCGSDGTDDNAQTSADTNPTETTAAETTTEENPEPTLPDLNYDGADFTYLIRGRNMSSYKELYIYQEELNGEVVNDAVVNRNGQVEDKFGIVIKAVETAAEADDSTLVQKYVLSNDPTIDVLSVKRDILGQHAKAGYLVDFNTVDHVNLTAKYWDANAVTELAIADKLYMMPNDTSMSNFASARFIFVNKKLLEDYSLDDPYQLVHDNKWTFDKMFEMASKVSEDLNGDGKRDHSDRYGFLAEIGANNGNIIHLMAAAGQQITVRDDKGMPVLNIMNERTQAIIDKVRNTLTDINTAIDYETLGKTADLGSYPHVYNYARMEMFTNDHFLFLQNGLNIIHQFSNMESDFGIIPNPKYEESQDSYGHLNDMYALLFAIPVTCSDLERAGAVLEYSGWLSSETLRPAFYETTVLNKRIRDERDVDMLDIINASCVYDVSQIYSLGASNIIWIAYRDGGTLASTYAANESAVLAKLDELITQFNK
nr:extracellular solute-binding protein [Clostridia bacterium]